MSDEKDLERWARLRFAVIGGLLAAPPKRGELKGTLLELSQRTWSHPNDGTAIRFGFSTLEHTNLTTLNSGLSVRIDKTQGGAGEHRS